MGKPKTAILWGRDDVLSRAIELFLSSNKDWEVITIRDTQPLKRLQKTIEDRDPQVVIIHQGDIRASSKDEKGLPLDLIQKHPGIKVITVSLENNTAEVFNKQQVYIQEICDLLKTLDE